jgi:transglutaminase-like putative cysteine protease
MKRLALALMVLAPAVALGGPKYALLTSPSKKVEAIFTWEFKAPQLQATEWVVVVAKPPDLPGQTSVSISAEPDAKQAKEESDLKQPILVWRIPANDDKLKTSVHIRVKTEATLVERRLVPLAPRAKAPKVAALGADERKLFLASTSRLNHDAQDFQDWLDANKLRRLAKETDVDFAFRVFLVIRAKFTYKFPVEHDGKATSTCKAGKGDCGCMSTVFVCACRANGIPARELCGRWADSAKGKDSKIHCKAEFYAEQVGWVPVDATLGMNTAGPDGLRFFGNDPGDFVVWHLDGDVKVDSIHWKVVPSVRLQGVMYWAAASGGNFDKSEAKEDWQVKTSLPSNRRK